MTYLAELLEPLPITVTFESTDMQTGNRLPCYDVAHTLAAGIRRFKTRKRALSWVDAVTKDGGKARFIGKAA